MRVYVADKITDKNITQAKPFNLTAFLRGVGTWVRTNPDSEVRSYANASHRLRLEAQKPENKKQALVLENAAYHLEILAAQHARGPVTPLQNLESGYEQQIEKDQEKYHAVARQLPISELDHRAFVIAASKVDDETGEYHNELTAAWRETEIDRKFTREDPAENVPSSVVSGRTVMSQQILCQFGGSNPIQGVGVGYSQGGQTAVQEGPIIRWDGEEEESQAVTLALTPASGGNYPAGNNGRGQNFSYRPFGHVFWGTLRGQPCEVLVDVGRGCQFSLAAAYLSANVGMEAPIVGSIPGSMMITGTLGFNPAGTASVIIRTRYVDNLAQNGVKNVIIPNFATQLLPLQRSDVSATSSVTLTFKDPAGDALYSFSLSSSTQQQQPIPLTGDVYSVDVTNGGQQTASFHLCFSLAL